MSVFLEILTKHVGRYLSNWLKILPTYSATKTEREKVKNKGMAVEASRAKS